jgi:hypothetical protein
MPERFHIAAVPTPARFQRIGKYGYVDWREDCARCSNCVKKQCTFDVHRIEAAYDRDPEASVTPRFDCRACLSCVQGCTKGLLSLSLNPEYLALGDEHWRPEVIATTWDQAESGRIPVSGAGYRGPFAGPGFDAMWTDMSEIVRPTRDGIHGREYINTSVDIGPKPMRLAFIAEGEMAPEAQLIEVPIPVALSAAPCGAFGGIAARAVRAAAQALGTLCLARADDIAGATAEQMRFIVPTLQQCDVEVHPELLDQVRMIEVAAEEAVALATQATALNRGLLICARVAAGPGARDEVMALHSNGIDVIHLCADAHGREVGGERRRYLKDTLREVHGGLVEAGVRDEVTLIASGGIALAEHMAKAIICGADMVAVDIALRVAVGCRVCSRRAPCAVEVQEEDVPYAAQRMTNLMGAWHSQLIEVLGAMGIREVRRLRGEVGRAIFLEDIEREAFGDLIRA